MRTTHQDAVKFLVRAGEETGQSGVGEPEPLPPARRLGPAGTVLVRDNQQLGAIPQMAQGGV
jgi:hypothetical protein